MVERRKGHSKLVYNKATGTIDTVDPHEPDVCPRCAAGMRHWWSYCAMCGYHIAGGALAPADRGAPSE